MSSIYNQLLDATIQHLEDMKSSGVRHVAVSPQTLRELAQPLKTASTITAQKNPVPASTPSPQPAELSLALPGVNVPAFAPLDSKEKTAAFAALRERALACVKCTHLASS